MPERGVFMSREPF